jgi:predicted nucleic acid-binding protein
MLHDAVTLQHFAIVGRLDILEDLHGHHAAPRWTDAVRNEVEEGARRGQQAAWLGPPAVPALPELMPIIQLQVGLTGGVVVGDRHLGEAESIFFAERDGGTLVTDDAGAYDFAERRLGLGPSRVQDTIEILRRSVGLGSITPADAAAVATSIVAAGRFLRRVHEGLLQPTYFT